VKRWSTALALVVAFALPGPAAAKDVPYLSGRVVDDAGLLSATARQTIESELATLEQQTTDQFVVLTVASLDGEPLESYSVQVAQTWKLGQKGKDNGVLLLIARDDRKLRLEVGYGLEGSLTDLASREILDDIIRPRFKTGAYDQGVEEGVDAVIKVLHGQALPPPSASKARPPLQALIIGLVIFVIVIGTFSIIALMAPGPISWFLYVFLVPFYLAFPTAFFSFKVGLTLTVAWLVSLPIFKLIAHQRGYFAKGAQHGPVWTAFAGAASHTTWSSGGGSSSGSGGFSGGGGGFGGGGASGGW
jgi:uncharacterized protein